MSTIANPDVIERRIVEAIANMGPDIEDVKRDATWDALDVDSLDLVELAQIAEDEFGVVIGAEEVKELKTVGDAIDLVTSRA